METYTTKGIGEKVEPNDNEDKFMWQLKIIGVPEKDKNLNYALLKETQLIQIVTEEEDIRLVIENCPWLRKYNCGSVLVLVAFLSVWYTGLCRSQAIENILYRHQKFLTLPEHYWNIPHFLLEKIIEKIQ